VTALVDAGRVTEYEEYMRRHIPDLLATGCFTAASLEKAVPGRYRVRYEASSQRDLDRYLRDHAQRLRADFSKHFPSGVTISREVWQTLQVWPTQPEHGNSQ
jgi:hypothetical protein